MLTAIASIVVGSFRQRMAFEPVNPSTVRSPSGAWSVHVDPDDRYGRKGCTVEATMGGRTVWRRKLDFVLQGTVVDNYGNVAAYGYDGGIDPSGLDKMNLHVLFLSASGVTRSDVLSRRHLWALDVPPRPTVGHFLVDYATEQLLVLDGGGGGYRWRRFDLRTGQTLCTRQANGRELAGRVWDASLVPKTGQVATLSYGVHENDPPSLGLFDGAGNMQASLRLAATIPLYSSAGRASLSYDVAALKLRLAYGRIVKLFRVDRDSSGAYSIVPAGEETVVERPEHPIPKAPAVTLKREGTISLGLPMAPSAFHNVMSAAVIDDSRVALLEWTQTPSIVIVGFDGKVIRTSRPIGITDRFGPKVTRFDSRRLLLTTDFRTPPFSVGAWTYDIETGETKSISLASFLSGYQTGPFITQIRVTGAGDGGVIVAGRIEEPTNAVTQVRRFDGNGRLAWKADLSDVIINEIAPDGGGAVLAEALGKITLIDAKGSLSSYTQAFGFYPTAIASSPAGAFAEVSLEALNGQHLQWLSRVGKVVRDVSARQANGVGISHLTSIFFDRAGALWGTDPYGLYRFNKDGVVDFAIGGTASKDEIHDLSIMSVGPEGRIYAIDRRTDVVHVFDRTGKWTYSTTQARKPPLIAIFDDLFPLTDGGFLSPTDALQNDYIGYDGHGRRITKLTAAKAMGWTPAGLRRGDGKLTIPLVRDANDRWFSEFEPKIVGAPDGSVARLDQETQADHARVTIVSPQGKSLTTFDVPASSKIAYDGHIVVINPGGDLEAFSKEGRPLWTFHLAKPAAPFLANGHLLLWTGKPELERYRLP